jgi:hypothetical protein
MAVPPPWPVGALASLPLLLRSTTAIAPGQPVALDLKPTADLVLYVA